VKVHRSSIPAVLIFEPDVFADARGFFYESYNKREFRLATGIDAEFVQDNISRSAKNVLRGLHYQIEQPQGKLVRVIAGEIWDVAVDIRRSSPTYGKWTGVRLSSDVRRAVWVPVGFAHGFFVLSDYADVEYKATDYYAPEHERCIRWNDPTLAIAWPLSGEPLVSEKDRQGANFAAADVFP